MDFNSHLTRWNGGTFRGAKRRFAEAIGVHETQVGKWSKGLPPGEDSARKIAAEFKVPVSAVFAMFTNAGKFPPPAGIEPGSLTRDVPMVPVLGRVSAERFSIAFDAEPEEMVPNPRPGRKLFALRISGDCMEPALREGELVYIDRLETPHDGQVVLAMLDGEFTLKRYRVLKDGVYLVPDNKRYHRIKVTTSKSVVYGVAVAALRRDI